MINDKESKEDLNSTSRAIFVDDSKGIREYTAVLLEGRFDSLEVVDDPSLALEKFQQENRPNILLTDGRMPGMTGVELIKKIKEIDPTITTILITTGGVIGGINVADPNLRENNGIDFYLEKPFSPKDLRSLVEEVKKVRGL